MKRTINESQLRAIVAESVKRVLNELDWKTYRNAQEKNQERAYFDALKAANLRYLADEAKYNGDNELADKYSREAAFLQQKIERTNAFGDAAKDAFFDEYLRKASNPHCGVYPTNSYSNYIYPLKDGEKYFSDGLEYSKNCDYGRKDGGYLGDEHNGTDSQAYSADALRSMGFNDKNINDIEAARREIRRYRNGDYKFDNGWKLKR